MLSRLAREVGVPLSRVDLGLELELDVGRRPRRGRTGCTWAPGGPVLRSYGWVFPEGGHPDRSA